MLPPYFIRKVRETLWPVKGSELGRFLPTILILFLITTVYNLLRPLKVSLIVSAEGSGSHVVPFLKVWGILPGTLVLTGLFAFLSSRYRRELVFNIMSAIFLGFYLLFVYILFPMREHLELVSLANYLGSWLPEGASGFVSMLRHWHLSLFYLFAELWGNIILNMLFWGLINEVTEVEVAKRHYSLLVIGANLGAISAGGIGLRLSQKVAANSSSLAIDDWERSVHNTILFAVFLGALILVLFKFLTLQIEGDASGARAGATKPDKVRFNLTECWQIVRKSRHIRYLTFIVLGYNVAWNLGDVLWVYQLESFFESSNDLNAFNNIITIVTGVTATLLAVLGTGTVIRRFGWFWAAIATPTVVGVTGLAFMPLIVADGFFGGGWMQAQGLVMFALVAAGAQHALTRASKYTFFDATKEMAYIPLSHPDKRKSKAAIDGIGSRLGKSGGSILVQSLMILTSGIGAAAPYLPFIILIILAVWIYSVVMLNRELKKVSNDF